jgi:hypothetical protein
MIGGGHEENVHKHVEELRIKIVCLRAISSLEHGGKKSHLFNDEIFFTNEAPISSIERTRCTSSAR